MSHPPASGFAVQKRKNYAVAATGIRVALFGCVIYLYLFGAIGAACQEYPGGFAAPLGRTAIVSRHNTAGGIGEFRIPFA